MVYTPSRVTLATILIWTVNQDHKLDEKHRKYKFNQSKKKHMKLWIIVEEIRTNLYKN